MIELVSLFPLHLFAEDAVLLILCSLQLIQSIIRMIKITLFYVWEMATLGGECSSFFTLCRSSTVGNFHSRVGFSELQ